MNDAVTSKAFIHSFLPSFRLSLTNAIPGSPKQPVQALSRPVDRGNRVGRHRPDGVPRTNHAGDDQDGRLLEVFDPLCVPADHQLHALVLRVHVQVSQEKQAGTPGLL